MAGCCGPAAGRCAVFTLRRFSMVDRGGIAAARMALLLLRPGATPSCGVADRRDGWRLRWLLIQVQSSDGADPASRFSLGKSGNPNGRRAGARNRTCALALKLMDADAEPVILALIRAAKGGDVAAIKLVLERVAPLPRNRPVQFAMPAIETAADLGEAMGAIMRAASDRRAVAR